MPLDRSAAYIRFPSLDTAKNLHISRYKSIGEGGGGRRGSPDNGNLVEIENTIFSS